MARHEVSISNKTLGIALIVGLLIQFVLPVIGVGAMWLGTLIYLLVALYLLFASRV